MFSCKSSIQNSTKPSPVSWAETQGKAAMGRKLHFLKWGESQVHERWGQSGLSTWKTTKCGGEAEAGGSLQVWGQPGLHWFPGCLDSQWDSVSTKQNMISKICCLPVTLWTGTARSTYHKLSQPLCWQLRMTPYCVPPCSFLPLLDTACWASIQNPRISFNSPMKTVLELRNIM